MKKRFFSIFIIICLFIASFVVSSKKSFTAMAASEKKTKENTKESNNPSKDIDFDGNLKIKDGKLLPMLNYSDMRDAEYTNEGSDIKRFCVYVETDYDTDNDGMSDLVKVLVQVPTGAVKGNFKAGTIYDPTPYNAGIVEQFYTSNDAAFLEKPFDYKLLYNKGKKRKKEGEMTSAEAADAANPNTDWNYNVPNSSRRGYSYSNRYDYYLVRGYAVVEASGIGTYGSEGYELCGRDLERDSHKCVVEWLTGNRIAYTDTKNNIQIKADWSNGNIAMVGKSYGGTLPFEVATTGVKGLKTIIPYAGIASWYDYTNSQGIKITSEVGYTDHLASFNCGGTFLDDDWTVIDDGYRSWLWQISKDEAETNGNYAPIWAECDYSDDNEKINCTALIVQGLNDYNVTTKQALMMYNAFKKADKPVKLFLHQDGHNYLDTLVVNDEPWLEIQNKWLAHYLYDVDNDIENMAEIMVQSNLTGKFTQYDSFGEYKEGKVTSIKSGDTAEVSSKGLAEYTQEKAIDNRLITDLYEDFFMNLSEENAAVYDIRIPDGATISGVPEIHLKLSTNTKDMDAMMITAVLVDTAKNGEYFKAYLTKDKLQNVLPTKTIDQLDVGGGISPIKLKEYVPSTTTAKCFTLGWTDLTNPGCGPDHAEYTETVKLESGKYYDYTIYMQPTVYTLDKGHQLKLVLLTWDPFRRIIDEGLYIKPSLIKQMDGETYSYVIDNSSVNVKLPLVKN